MAVMRPLLAPLAALALSVATAHADSRFDFDGTWTGALKFDKASPFANPKTPDSLTFTIGIDGRAVEISGRDEDGETFQFCQQGCTLDQTRSNAVIYGINNGQPGSDGTFWVETWTFTVALRDADHMIVEYTRLVRNVGVDKAEGDVRPVFSTRASGALEREAATPRTDTKMQRDPNPGGV